MEVNETAERRLMQRTFDTGDVVVNSFIAFAWAANVISRYIEKNMAKLDLSNTEARTLVSIKRRGGFMTPTGLSQWLKRHKNSVSILISNLEQKGMVKRSVSKEDSRSLEIRLTAKGNKIAEQVVKSEKDMAYDTLSAFAEEDVDKFCQLSNMVIENIRRLIV